jgi:hypothetical protein
MSRTTLTVQQLVNITAGTPAANSLDVTFAAADSSNGNDFVCSDKDLLLVLNSDGTNPYTFTVASVIDSYGRLGDITTYSLSAGEYGAIELPANLFRQSTGKININGSNAAVKFAILRRS